MIQTNASYYSKLSDQVRRPAFAYIPMRALLLEGSQQGRFVYERMFKDLGFEEIDVAENFSDAFQCVEIKHEPYDLIVLDQAYWGDEALSLKLCRIIRANEAYRHTAILMISNQCDSDTIEAAFRSGVDEIIPKYIHPLELKRLSWNAVYERRHATHSH
jgi:DNA-binding response OmpR family regulator